VVLQAVEHGRPVSADVMNALHDSALPELAKGLTGPNLKVRRLIAEHWRDLGARGGVGAPMLIQSLRDPDATVRKEAAKSLGAVQAEPDLAAPPLIESSRDPFPMVRLAAVESLGGFRSRAASVLPVLVERLADADAAVREGAVGSLTQFGEQKAIAAPLLAGRLSGTDEAARQAAMRAAIGLDALSLLPPEVLVPFIESSERGWALKVVETLMQKNPKAVLFVPGLVGRLRQLDDKATAPRQDAFAQLGAPAVPALVRMLSYQGEAASPSEQEFKEAEVVRYEAAMALAAIGSEAKAALPTLEERSASEPSEHVRSAVIEALRRVKSERALWRAGRTK
jgi:HEAT repeat protein